MSNIFDEKGVIVNNALDFRELLNKEASIAFSDKLEGKQLRLDDSSVIGRLFATISKALAQNAEIIPIIFQSLDMNTAEGKQLDNLLWNIHRVERRGASQATAFLHLHGDIGKTVPKGSVVSSSMTSDSFRTDSTVKFSNTLTNGVDISFDDTAEDFSLKYSIDGFLSDSPSITVKKDSPDTTIKKIAERFADAVNSHSTYLSASKNNDNSVKVSIKDEGATGSFTTSGGASVVRSTMPVYATSSTFDSSYNEVGQISTILTPVLGWRSVRNPYSVFSSVGIEDDEEYRSRGKLFQKVGVGKYNSILMELRGVKGVTYQNIRQNTSARDTTDGVKNNGIAITVMGGNEDEIALAIFNSVSEGIMTSGDITKEVKDINGFGHIVRFSRPKKVPLEISMSLITYPDYPSNGNIRIKQALVDWFNNLDVGEDIHYSRLYQPINTIDGFAVKNLKFGFRGRTLGIEDVIINHNEIATISAEDISIGGN